MTKAVFTCPQCQKVVHDLNAHTRRMHKPDGGHVKQISESVAPETSQPAAEVLTVKKPTRQAAPVTYHCVDCGNEFSGQVAACPGCNAKFNWEGVGNG